MSAYAQRLQLAVIIALFCFGVAFFLMRMQAHAYEPAPAESARNFLPLSDARAVEKAPEPLFLEPTGA